MACVIAVDAGTSGIRALALDDATREVVDIASHELKQHFPRPGWVEHDPTEILDLVLVTLGACAERQAAAGRPIAAVGVTNQRETVVAWDRRTGRPRHRAIVWQDRRTTSACDRLRQAGLEPEVRRRTGLVLDPYFSATKMRWLLEDGGVEADADLVLGTIDAWITWNLTGGPHGGALVTDPSNASRTLLWDLTERRWSAELADIFRVPLTALPEVRPTCGRLGSCSPDTVPAAAPGNPLAGVPVSAVVGDQQAALFGQACFDPGMAKATYGTGTFVLTNVGPRCPDPLDGLLTSVAWDLGDHGAGEPVAFAVEGAVFTTGAAIQWLRDGLGIIPDAAAIGPLAASVPDSGGAVLVPAFTGLGSPWWDATARGAIFGLTRGVGAAHLARATLEAIAFQVRDVLDALAPLRIDRRCLRVDGGVAAQPLLLQLQADQLRIPVARPRSTETTAVGAAMIAGLAEGVWGSLDELADAWVADIELGPEAPVELADAAFDTWHRAVHRARGWARP